MSKQEKIVKKMILQNLEGLDLPENFGGVAVDIYPTTYGRQLDVTILFKKPFTKDDSDMFHDLSKNIKDYIKKFFVDIFDGGIGFRNSTIETYNKQKKYYEDKKINISENKKMGKEQLKLNLKNSINKVANLIYGIEPEYINLPTVTIEDIDYSEESNKLYMVLISIEFDTYTDGSFSDFVNTCKIVYEKLNDVLNRISFDNEGKLKSPSTKGGVFFNGEGMISEVKVNYRDENIHFKIDYMFGQ